ncbi:MAG: carboxylating nicotinate-nucleotide diphosphorylase [Bacillota bacterium]|jgi:nicotinate-nucleotide pyrophosphorylase (carboxylating)
MPLNKIYLEKIIKQALEEDLGMGDLTSTAIFSPDHQSKAEIIVKEETIVCGIPIAEQVFSVLSPKIDFIPFYQDGDHVNVHTVIAEITGPTHLLLSGERIALNFLQRLSGIANLTAKYVFRVKNYPAKIVDTRKTTPGLRFLEKYAVRTGGGTNHRLGLFDAVMIKDNHIKAAGGIREAVQKVKNGIPFLTPIEVEVSTVDEALVALEAGVDVIMLDNMPAREMARAVKLIAGRALVEASGGITFERLEEVAATGVDIISVGALTHSAVSVDISMKIKDVY